MRLSKVDNSCTLLYLSRLNDLVAAGDAGMTAVKKKISAGIAGKIGGQPTAAVIATANTEDQRDCLRELGFLRMRAYRSHAHKRDVFVYIRATSEEEHKRGCASWFFNK